MKLLSGWTINQSYTCLQPAQPQSCDLQPVSQPVKDGGPYILEPSDKAMKLWR